MIQNTLKEFYRALGIGGTTVPLRAFSPLLPLLLAAACGQSPSVSPVATSYPAGRVETIESQMNLPIPITVGVNATLSGAGTSESTSYSPGSPTIRIPIRRTIEGDQAEQELWIVPRSRSEFSERRLMDRIAEGGRRTCGSSFRVKDSRYFYGSEGTLQLSNISTPALRVTYRCPASRLRVNEPNAQRVMKIARRFPDHAYFDVMAFQSSASINRLKGVMRSIFGEGITSLNGNRQSFELVASKQYRRYVTVGPENEFADGIPENVIIVANATNEGSRFAIMRMTYQPTVHVRGVSSAGTERAGYLKSPQPVSRDFADLQTRRLASTIIETAE